MPNGLNGVEIINAPGNTLGPGDTISANTNYGVVIAGPGAYYNQVLGEVIGADPSGMITMGNGDAGIGILDAPLNTIGQPLSGIDGVLSIPFFSFSGSFVGSTNLIDASGFVGIFIAGSNAFGNIVQGNFIGVDALGDDPALGSEGNTLQGNHGDGITIQGARHHDRWDQHL